MEVVFLWAKLGGLFSTPKQNFKIFYGFFENWSLPQIHFGAREYTLCQNYNNVNVNVLKTKCFC